MEIESEIKHDMGILLSGKDSGINDICYLGFFNGVAEFNTKEKILYRKIQNIGDVWYIHCMSEQYLLLCCYSKIIMVAAKKMIVR